MQYVVVNADIINSKGNYFKKEDIAEKINLLNANLSDQIFIGFSVLRGDEIQGVLRLGADLFRVLRHLIYAAKPYDIRIGVGIGEIYDLPEPIQTSWELNGEAFFRARDAMNFLSGLKRNDQYRVSFVSVNQKLDERITLFYSYAFDIISSWDPVVFDIIKMAEAGCTHQEIAESIYDADDTSIKSKRVNITKKIKRANWYKLKKTEEMLNEMLLEGGSV